MTSLVHTFIVQSFPASADTLLYTLHFLRPYHAVHADDDEGNGENLSHVDGQGGLEGFLNLLGVLNEEAEGEDIGQTEAKIPATTYIER